MGVLLHIKAITREHYSINGVETKAVIAEIEDIDSAVNRKLEDIRAEAESDDEKSNFDIVVFDIIPIGQNTSLKQVVLISFGYAESVIDNTDEDEA